MFMGRRLGMKIFCKRVGLSFVFCAVAVLVALLVNVVFHFINMVNPILGIAIAFVLLFVFCYKMAST